MPVYLGLSVPLKENVHASAYCHILENSLLPALREPFWGRSFSLLALCATVHKVRYIKARMNEFAVEEINRPAHSPNICSVTYL